MMLRKTMLERVALGRGVLASMRPQHDAAENSAYWRTRGVFSSASMRPQHDAAENAESPEAIIEGPTRFNEAAA